MKQLYTFYRIFDDSENYIGVTMQKAKDRMTKHFYRAHVENNQSVLYRHIRKSTSLKYQVIEQEFLTKEDAHNKELMYIQFLKPSLNTIHAK